MKSTIPTVTNSTKDRCLSELSIFSISDLHLNNRRIGARRLCANVLNFLERYSEEIKFSDVFVIGGDFFDTLLFHPSEDTKYIYEVIFRILGMCAEHDVMLIVLNGTRTHDWDQCRDFIYLSTNYGDDLNIRYIEDMEILEIKGKQIMFVPDELHHNSKDTYDQAQEMIATRGLQQVDALVIHGGFSYQLDFPGVDAHDQHLWMGLVKYLIISGHIHVSIPYGTIVPNGSFDMLVFGEARDKGGWLFTFIGEVVAKQRLSNTDAIYFEIFNVDETESLEDVMGRLKTLLSELPDGSYISIRPPVGHPINHLMLEIKRSYPLQNFYKETYGTVVKEVEEITYDVIEIHEGNLVQVFTDFTEGEEHQSEMLEVLLEIMED